MGMGGNDLIAKELTLPIACQEKITLGIYEAVRVFVSNAILDCCKAESMTVLHELYGTDF